MLRLTSVDIWEAWFVGKFKTQEQIVSEIPRFVSLNSLCGMIVINVELKSPVLQVDPSSMESCGNGVLCTSVGKLVIMKGRL